MHFDNAIRFAYRFAARHGILLGGMFHTGSGSTRLVQMQAGQRRVCHCLKRRCVSGGTRRGGRCLTR